MLFNFYFRQEIRGANRLFQIGPFLSVLAFALPP